MLIKNFVAVLIRQQQESRAEGDEDDDEAEDPRNGRGTVAVDYGRLEREQIDNSISQ